MLDAVAAFCCAFVLSSPLFSILSLRLQALAQAPPRDLLFSYCAAGVTLVIKKHSAEV
jgi:hypothetical protein